MPFCPKCKYEYKAGTDACADCNTTLVESLAQDDSPDTYKDWIPLARLTSSQYAEMVLECLRAKDIPAVIHSDAGHFGQTGQMGTSSFRPVGGAYTLMVPRDHVIKADSEAGTILGDVWEKSRLCDLDEY